MHHAGVLLGASKRRHRTATDVVDGASSATDSPAQLEVVGATGSATVSWTAPTLKGDGSAADIDHYLIYVGTTPGEQHNGGAHMGGASPFTVAAGTLTKTVTGLAPGPWYFGGSTVNSSGLEGNSSPEAFGVVT